MNKDEMLQQLLALRRRKEERAREIVAARELAARRAVGRAEAAASAVTRHADHVNALERALIDRIVGQAVSGNTVDRLKVDVETQHLGGQALIRAAMRAEVAAKDRLAALGRAQDTLRERQRDVAKLDAFTEEQKKKSAKQREIKAEAEEEDQLSSSEGFGAAKGGPAMFERKRS